MGITKNAKLLAPYYRVGRILRAAVRLAIMVNMANRIREHRERRGLSQPELAKLLVTTPQTVSKLETGVQRLNDRWLASISAALAVPQSALLVEDGAHGAVPSESDIVQTDLERLVLRFWRSLPPQGQDDIVKRMTAWSAARISRMAQSV